MLSDVLGQIPLPQGSNARIPVRVKYLLSTQWSSATAVIHFFCLELRRGSFGVPTQRVVCLVDEPCFRMGFDEALQRCVNVSRVEAMCLLPRDVHILEGRPISTQSPIATQPQGLAPMFQGDPMGMGVDPSLSLMASGAQQNDIDLFLQQADAQDFMRILGALYKPNLIGGSPPLIELEEGQPLGGNKVNCRCRVAPLKMALVDGVSKDALNALCEEHNRQIRVLREKWSNDKAEMTTDTADLFAQRDALRNRIVELEKQLVATEHSARTERDRMRLQIAQLQEDLHRSREETKMLKLLRAGGGGLIGQAAAEAPLPVERLPVSPTPKFEALASPALSKLRDEVAASEAYLANLRSGSASSRISSSSAAGPGFRH